MYSKTKYAEATKKYNETYTNTLIMLHYR